MSSHEDNNSRRDFLALAGPAFAAVGGAVALWPFVSQMNPDAGALALSSTEVDLAPIKEGQAITVQWRGKPVFIRHRNKQEIDEAKAVALRSLPDPQADSARTKKGSEQWLVLVGVCTHLGCSPQLRGVDAKAEMGGDWAGGFFCPCHGSKFDYAGRVFKGAPAPLNLPVPPHTYLSEGTILIGEDKKGA